MYTIALLEREILLTEGQGTEPIDKLSIPYKSGRIDDLVFGQNDSLYIKGNQLDYITKIDFNRETPSFGSAMPFPELYRKPCTRFARFFDNCLRSFYSTYSTTIGSAFVSGYLPLPSPREHVRLEVSPGSVKPIHKSLNWGGGKYMGDVPSWNGFLFQHPKGNALFYDGVTVSDLSEDFLKLKSAEKFDNWSWKKADGGRTFIGKFTGRSKDDPSFLMELKNEPGFEPIFLPEELDVSWLRLATTQSSSKSRLWIVTRNSILAEVGNQLHTVVTIPQPFNIVGPISAEKSKDGDILFTVEKENDRSESYNKSPIYINYSLNLSSQLANCEVILNNDQPVLLEP